MSTSPNISIADWLAMDPQTRDVINATWARLPVSVQRALADVTFCEAPSAAMPGRYADAGPRDIRIRSGLKVASTPAIVGIIAHELGHIAGAHFQLVASGQMTVEAAEIEADQYAASWGFGPELQARKSWIGM